MKHHDVTRRPRRWPAVLTTAATVLALLVPAQPATAAPQTVSGNISFGTPGNHPGATAKISWERSDGSSNWPDGDTTAITEADGDFTLSLEPGTYRLRVDPLTTGYQGRYWNGASRDWLATPVVVTGSAVTGLDMTLPLKGSIDGRVFLGSTATPAGAGVARVTIEYCETADYCSSANISPVLTDAQGRYAFADLWSGDFRLSFAYLGGTGYQAADPVRVTVTDTDLFRHGVDAVLPPAPSLSGRVQLGSGRYAGAGEVVVTAWKSSVSFASPFTTSTDAEGRWGIAGLVKGSYRLQFDYVGSDGFADEWWGDALTKASATSTELTTTEVVRDVRLAPGASVSGVVLDSAGAPISGVDVKAQTVVWPAGQAVITGTATTGADGRFTVRGLPAGTYTIHFDAPSPYAGSLYGSDPNDPAYPGTIELVAGQQVTGLDHVLYRRTSLSGRVTCARCDMSWAAASLSVVLERDMSTTSTPRWEHVLGESPTAVWNDPRAARYDVGPLIPGRYRIHLSASGPLYPTRQRSAVLTIEEGQAAVFDFRATFTPALDRDFTGDGPADVLTRTPSGVLRVYSGTGTGTLRPAKTIGTGWTFTSVFSVGDFSGDGFADVMARDAAGRLLLYRGNGAGGWAGSAKVGSGWGAFTALFSPGNFTGDSYPDVMARTAAGELWLYPGDGNGGWKPRIRVGTGWAGMTAIFPCGDFDGDRNEDIMARDAAGRLILYRGNGDGGWLGSRVVGTGWNMFDAIVGASDLNGDEFADVLARTPNGDLLLYRGNGSGGWLGAVRVGTGWQGLSLIP
jgi:hypothetical protein